MEPAPLISIIIPNLDGMKYLPACLASIQKQTFREFEVIIIENGSKDGSVDFIRTGFPEATIIENEKNQGFAMANNQGIMNAKGKYIATLNNDTETDKDWLKNLIVAAEAYDYHTGTWAPKIISLEKKDQIDSVGALLIYTDVIESGWGCLNVYMQQ